MSSETQQHPPWSHRPTKDSWKLVEIKGGVQVAEHELGNRACTVLGRAADVVDVALLHASCSRKHARIAFDSTGTAWLKDYGSAHGTSINKKAIPSEACGPHESQSTRPGARGVVIYPGDIIQFGASSRIFCVEGPAECSRAATAAAAASAKAAATTNTSTTTTTTSSSSSESNVLSSSKKREEGVSWGISMDDDVDDGGDDDAPSSSSANKISMDSINDDNIPDKHRKEWDKLKALKYKLGNVQTESERISRKQSHDELTTGQERQLERNQERISALQEDIGRKEDALWRKLYPDEAAPKRSNRNKNSGGDAYVDEDEVDDRTNQRTGSGVTLDEDGETEQSLTGKWKQQFERLKLSRNTLRQAEDRAAQLTARRSRMGDDDEEAFFAENECNLANEKVQKLQSEHDAIMSSLSELERLLKVANPKLTVDAKTGYIGIGTPMMMMMPQPNNAAADAYRGGDEGFFPPPAAVMATTKISNSLDDGFAMPAPRRPTSTIAKASDAREVVLPDEEAAAPSSSSSATPSSGSSQEQQQQQPPAKRRKRSLGPSMPPDPASPSQPADNNAASRGTLAMMMSATSSSSSVPASGGGGVPSLKRKDRQQNYGRDPATGTDSKSNNNTLPSPPPPPPPLGILDDPDAADPRNDVWHAPKDQDGSGRTKLNKKFEGRY